MLQISRAKKIPERSLRKFFLSLLLLLSSSACAQENSISYEIRWDASTTRNVRASWIVAVEDFNSDGPGDVALISKSGAEPVLLLSQHDAYVLSPAIGNAVFEGTGQATKELTASRIAAGDIDGDSDPFVLSFSELHPHFMLNNGDDTFTVRNSDGLLQGDINWPWDFITAELFDVVEIERVCRRCGAIDGENLRSP